MKPADYHKMSMADKEAYQRDRLREPTVRCPACDAAMQPCDLVAHTRERCQGRPAPHPMSLWVSRKEAIAMGVTKRALHRAAQNGKIRTKGKKGRTRFLVRDIAKYIAVRSSYKAKSRPSRKPNGIPNSIPNSEPKRGAEMQDELKQYVSEQGGFEPAARMLRIPASTLKRALKGSVRQATRALIEQRLREVA